MRMGPGPWPCRHIPRGMVLSGDIDCGLCNEDAAADARQAKIVAWLRSLKSGEIRAASGELSAIRVAAPILASAIEAGAADSFKVTESKEG